jgi:hypothetical protein
MTDLDRAIAAVEAATEGSRELDALVAVAVRWRGDFAFSPDLGITETHSIEYGETVVISFGGWPQWSRPAPTYTTSLDAALTLVPEGAKWEVRTLYGIVMRKAYASVSPNHGEGGRFEGKSEDGNVILALCLAALRAIRAMEGK